ncbi:ABC transporter permease [Bordetella bronchiseptica]|nr:ABC transporter permease [Bordetella bronchiseptica]KDD54677.1 ABC transporter, permease protein [Bordetella bronchiseptica OSU553]KCV51994.1 ABC transporter, permease protein [Bordetella bronchiseptica 7E71]KDC22565.1 ABC transporter, permease protein [Bordetella bronchiseptica F-1]KDC28842.1 ABC transporter, permease protein [Bordetella bronchiseptica F2]KDD42628.1 ABC transporter, permease protein [Bordetella bronchiseptica MBORD901]
MANSGTLAGAPPVEKDHKFKAGAMIQWLLKAIPLIVLFVCWEFASRTFPTLALLLPPPSEVITAAMELMREGSLQRDVIASLRRVFVALGVAAGIGLPLGLLMGMSKGISWFLEPIINFFRPIPPLAWIPLSIVWLGVSEAQNEFIIFLGAFFPILLNAVQGIRQVDPQIVRAAKTLGASPLCIACTVLIPGALPSIFVGFRVGTGIAWMALVAGEIVAASSGLGYLIMQGRLLFRPDYIIVGMVVIGLIGLALDLLLREAQRRIMRWENT